MEKFARPLSLAGALLLCIGFVYQTATPFFLSVGTIVFAVSGLLRFKDREITLTKVLFSALWLFGLLSIGYSSDSGNAWNISTRQLGLLLIPIGFLPKKTFKDADAVKIILTFSSLLGLFALISLFRYFIHKNAVDLALVESGAIPIWDGISWPWRLTALTSSKFLESGVSHIYFSVLQCLAIFIIWHKQVVFPKWLFLSLISIHIITLHWFFARTGILAFYGGITWYAVIQAISSKRLRKRLLWLTPLTLAFMLLIYFGVDAVRNKVDNSLQDLEAVRGERDINHRSLAMRVEAWKTCLDVIGEHPIVGVGIGDLDAAMEKQYVANDTQLYPENRIPPHNQYLETWAGKGLPAMLCLLGIFVFGIRRAKKRHQTLSLLCFSAIGIALLFESMFQTQLGICMIPFLVLLITTSDE